LVNKISVLRRLRSLESKSLVLVTKIVHLLAVEIVYNPLGIYITCLDYIASVAFVSVFNVCDSRLSTAAAVANRLVYAREALTQSLLNVCEPCLLGKHYIVNVTHNCASAKATSYIVSGSDSTEFVSHLLTSISSPAVAIAPTAKEKEQNPPAVAAKATVVTVALTYSVACCEFITHSESS
jgi:hypothetical protein